MILVIAWLTLIFFVREKYADNSIYFLLFILSWPLYKLTLNWIGKSDTLLLIGYLFIFFCSKKWRILGALVLVLAHKELGSIILIFESLYLWNENKINAIYDLFIGCIGALAIHFIYLNFVLSQKPQSRLAFALKNLNIFFSYFLTHWYLYVLSLIMPILPLLCVYKYKPTKIFTLCVFISFCLAIVAADTSRIFCLLLLPVIFHTAEAVVQQKIIQKSKIKWLGFLLPLLAFEITSTPILLYGRPMKYLSYFL